MSCLCHLLTYFICSKPGSLGSMDPAQGCNRRDDARAGAGEAGVSVAKSS